MAERPAVPSLPTTTYRHLISGLELEEELSQELRDIAKAVQVGSKANVFEAIFGLLIANLFLSD